MRHIISILVENQFGVLARVSGLFSARGYNIDSLCVAETEDPAVSRMTVVVRGDDRVLAQIEKQLKKLVETIDVEDLTGIAHVERELVMVRVKAKGKKRSEVIEIANIFRAKVVDLSPDSIVVEATGSAGKVKAFVDMMHPFGIEELVRTGKIAIGRSLNNNEAKGR
ncbi:MAG TPA: acetolactate synthase small subunit [Candidatus Hydrogenedentes bacterium]|jgi:acetolactate synthase-1/3 small subunit|nr:acetolactate synthase small subunit [Candidatus Hydrogenedentota bacterium]MDY0030409.1 acetolactate synthase small subunit [FCB group bacterium]NLT61782.1 acetolactate synthase small subunit [Candidatus Hydrogenedentota bacterium]HNV20985.1 acetolactate synthase small subunit [Candidatus Hydrogenedentota bacterium]HNZ19026.1 acetolactate synthase small subunit [Candidatus Hydrogenedentota bacterium]